MQASEKDSKTFHKLIKQQRSNHPFNTDILYIGNTKYEGENILEAWSIHFEKLGTPNYDKNIYDLERLRLAKLRNDIILKNQYSKKEIEQTNPEEVKTAIKNLNTGKTSDENGICSEHYKEAVDEVSVDIASIINNIFTNLDVPKSLKNGILTPVLKNKIKNKTIPGNYRGIVVTSIFSKIFESIVKRRLEYELLSSQNPLQRGFTEGASSLFAAFITTETILLYRLLQIILELVAVDAEKAFDTLSHEIMLNKLFHDGIEGDMWILLRNIYQDLSLKVKWNNETSESINILQGVRQGAKLSSLLYKRYKNTILNAISNSNLSAKLGNIHVGSLTCADDIALLGEQSDIQAMLGIIEFHSKRYMVKINPDKSEIMCVSKGSKQQSQSYNFNGKEIKRVEKLKHLGITRATNGKVNLDERLKTGRQTIYALLGSDLHARTGMSTKVLKKVWKTYAVPRHLYGLEVQICTKKNISELEKL
ncbi:unnamed protein product [Mytilus coruscus]|uniref:Reverse transcriptase domain-containing protein n=1 Tax=Mytilus coruscus TaxID=42192 RepID=A0A6J8C8M7_MYTCO|nr:unnamed protein product [Mytilus coruscus]